MPRVCQSAEAMVRLRRGRKEIEEPPVDGDGGRSGDHWTATQSVRRGRDPSPNPDSWEGGRSRLGVLNLQKALGLW